MIARPITTILHAWRVARAVLVLAGCRFAWPRVTPWEDAPEWQKTSVRNGVRGALNGNTPEQSHEGWLAEKAATGWKYGPVKDPEKKEHPCFVPYSELPPAQRAKDEIYTTVVRVVGAALRSV